MKSYVKDITNQFNADNQYKLDVSEWQNVTIQVVDPSGSIDLSGSNDARAITGVSDGNAVSSDNYSTIQATNLADGALVTAITTDGLYSIKVLFKFLSIGGVGAQATKVLLFFNKPY